MARVHLFALATILARLAAAAGRLFHWDWKRRKQERFDDRFRRGLCLSCGYNLYGASTHCPECGRSIDPRVR